MKKLLIASTALVATAGMASADITISGSANAGYYSGLDSKTGTAAVASSSSSRLVCYRSRRRNYFVCHKHRRRWRMCGRCSIYQVQQQLHQQQLAQLFTQVQVFTQMQVLRLL